VPDGDRDASSASELLSIVDAAGRRLPGVERSIVHQEGLWHEVFHCLIVRSCTPGRVVLQRRRRSSNPLSLLLDLSVTGHLQAGETPLDGVRELSEELGIDVDPQQLVPLGSRLFADDRGEGTNRELVHAYLLSDDRPLEEFTLDPSEVSGLVELTIDDLLTILHSPQATVPCRSIGIGGQPVETTCRQSELVPIVDGYWTVIAVMAGRFARREWPIGI
jgi:8-oxo-dGTP pyrophosphatase MutT (NUDIX family)